MSNSLKVIAIVFVAACCGLALDGLLPVEEMDTDVHHLAETGDSIAYVVPGTGGELATCSIGGEELSHLPPHTEIVVQRTLILSRCVGVKQMRCVGLVCSSGSGDAIDTDSFVRNAVHFAYGDRYSSIYDLTSDYPGYSPQVRRWPNTRGPLYRLRYSVRLPDQLVIFDKDGNVLTSRKCGSVEGICQAVAQQKKSDA